jgi:hypothetical protein
MLGIDTVVKVKFRRARNFVHCYARHHNAFLATFPLHWYNVFSERKIADEIWKKTRAKVARIANVADCKTPFCKCAGDLSFSKTAHARLALGMLAYIVW